VYERHDPEALALHRVVRENLATFYAAIEEGWQTGLPDSCERSLRDSSTAASCNEASRTLRAKIAPTSSGRLYLRWPWILSHVPWPAHEPDTQNLLAHVVQRNRFVNGC